MATKLINSSSNYLTQGTFQQQKLKRQMYVHVPRPLTQLDYLQMGKPHLLQDQVIRASIRKYSTYNTLIFLTLSFTVYVQKLNINYRRP